MIENKKFDLAIAYRIYPKVSKTPFIFRDDKLKLAEVGVRTLKSSLGPLKAKVFFILDNCPEEYEKMILRHFEFLDIEFVRYEGIGNLASFGKQINILLKQTDADVVFFAEDDYVYRKDLLPSAVQFIQEKGVDFITPYDHLDSYTLPIHTKNKYNIIISHGLHWRTSASTCLTFLTRKETLRKTETVFRSYCHGNWDSCLWFSLTKFNVFNLITTLEYLITNRFLFKVILLSWMKMGSQILWGRKYQLWQPIPSIATHMEHTDLAPNIDWQSVAGLYRVKH